MGIYVNWTDEANNRSRVTWYVNVYGSGVYYSGYTTRGSITISNRTNGVGSGGYFLTDDGVNRGTSYTPWSIWNEQTSMSGMNSWNTIVSGSLWLYHGSRGYIEMIASGNFESDGYYGTPYMEDGGWWQTNSNGGGLTDFNRSAYQASAPSVSRSSDGRTMYMSVADPGAYNSGPQRDFDWQLHTAGGGWFGIGATDAANNSYAVDPNTTYYARVLAYNEDGNNGWSGESVASYGIPTAPGVGSPSQITTAQKRISVPFSSPGYTGSGITSYTISRSGTPSASFSGITSSPYIDTDTNLIPGNSYTYSLTASSSQFTSGSSGSSSSVTASGAPYAPTSPPTFTVNGLDIEVTSSAVSGNGGVAIDTANASQGYFVQYQTATTQDGVYGYNNVAGAWSPAVKMENQASRKHKYTSLTPAIFYKFRTYAANSVQFDRNNTTQLYYPHNNSSYTANFATTTTGYFLAAGGRRWTGSEWTPTATAKRWDGQNWQAFTTAKRWNGNSWENLS